MKSILVLSTILLVTTLSFGDKDSHENHDMKSKTETEVGVQVKCPVMGGDINKELFVDHEGKRVYVCCQMCINKVKAKPETYISQLEEEGIELEEILD